MRQELLDRTWSSLAGSVADDQKRVMTPMEAKKIGADYIVVGRPITLADDPVEVYERCLRESFWIRRKRWQIT